MELTKYAQFQDYMVSEFQLSCYYWQQEQSKFEHELLNKFDIYDDDFIFEQDDGLTILLSSSHPIKNATNVNQFTNFNRIVETSHKFVNVLFIYSICITSFDDEIELFVDVYIQNGQVIDDKCVGCVYDDTIVD